MEAKELMIGDWVKFNLYPFTAPYTPYKVSLNAIYRAAEDAVVLRFEPIPLTPEILEKNGFEYREFTSCESMHYDHSVAVYLKDRKVFMLIGGEQRWIEFVHELQHALRLCGLNELADNFKIE